MFDIKIPGFGVLRVGRGTNDPADDLYRISYDCADGLFVMPGTWKTAEGARRAAERRAAKIFEQRKRNEQS